MNNMLLAIARILHRKGRKIYFWLFRASLRVFFSPLKFLSHFDDFREELDWMFQTDIKKTFDVELEKSAPFISVKNNQLLPRLTAVDIGARGGPIDVILKNRHIFDRIILCEGERKEAKKLREEGFEVIDKFVGGEVGRGKFYYIATHPGACSLKKPATKFMEIYGDKDYYLAHLNYKEIDVNVTDLPIELERLNINQIDLLKLDIQGYEYEVLSSFLKTSIRPLIIHCEVMLVPSYFDTRYGCEMDTLLLDAHYICVRRFSETFRGGMPIECDQLYVPNPLQKKGYKIIEHRIDDFLILSKMYRFEKLAKKLLEISEVNA